MNTIKTITLAAFACSILGVLAFTLHTTDDRPIIGIIQTASHPALDAALDGFKQATEKLLGSRFKLVAQNAQGDVTQAKAIATRFAHDSAVKLIFCIATPALQAALSTKTSIPLFFTAVSNPSVLNLNESPCTVDGCCDMIDCFEHMKSSMKLVPQTHTVAIIHNNAEVNASLMAQRLEHALKKLGKAPALVAVNSVADMNLIAPLSCKKHDAIVCPIDNMVAISIDTLARHAQESQTPLFVCDNMLLRPGVLASCGVDYHQLGVISGSMAAKHLLTGEKVTIITSCDGITSINEPTAKNLNILQEVI